MTFLPETRPRARPRLPARKRPFVVSNFFYIMSTVGGVYICVRRCTLFTSCYGGRCVVIDLLDDLADAGPKRQIGEYLYDTAVIGEGRLLEHGQVFHHAVVDDVFLTSKTSN